MAKTIFEEMGGKYQRQGDYLIPCLTVPAEEEQPIGIWGQRHLDYLKHHCKVTYTNLLTSGRLNAYLADIDRQAQERFERLIEGMKQAQGITEQLKAENALEWTGCLNNIRACAREIVEKEIIWLEICTKKGIYQRKRQICGTVLHGFLPPQGIRPDLHGQAVYSRSRLSA